MTAVNVYSCILIQMRRCFAALTLHSEASGRQQRSVPRHRHTVFSENSARSSCLQAAPKHTIDVVDKEKLTLFKTLVDISGATKAFSNEKARVTVLAPTNAVGAATRRASTLASLI